MQENENLCYETEPQEATTTVEPPVIDETKAATFKVVQLKRGHILAFGLAAALCLGGAGFLAHSYLEAKEALELSQSELEESKTTARTFKEKADQLQIENKEYTENIQQIQEKTTAMEQKINELEHVKQELTQKLDTLGSLDSSAATMSQEVATTVHEAEAVVPEFTTIVSTSYNKVTSLAAQLNKMDGELDEAGISFTEVATDVTETLASFSGIPSGMPVKTWVTTTTFNPTGDPTISDGRSHKGIDLSTYRQVAPIYATAAGTVIKSEFHGGFGNYVVIDHGNGFTTLYAHNSENLVAPGDRVRKGQNIAMSGSTGQSTGIHCHYEVMLNGVYQDPMNFQ